MKLIVCRDRITLLRVNKFLIKEFREKNIIKKGIAFTILLESPEIWFEKRATQRA